MNLVDFKIPAGVPKYLHIGTQIDHRNNLYQFLNHSAHDGFQNYLEMKIRPFFTQTIDILGTLQEIRKSAFPKHLKIPKIRRFSLQKCELT